MKNPWQDNYWRERILTDAELAEALDLAKQYQDANRETTVQNKAAITAFLREMEAMGHGRRSNEYRYVEKMTTNPRRLATHDLTHDIKRVQDELKRKAEQMKRDEERRSEALAKLVADAKMLGIDVTTYFGCVDELKRAVADAKEAKFDELIATAPYYVRASFYGHCLRNDWSEGRRSFGCRELIDLDVPDADPQNADKHDLAMELVEDAIAWEGDDGRYFRSTYQSLDALLNDEESKMLEFLDGYWSESRY